MSEQIVVVKWDDEAGSFNTMDDMYIGCNLPVDEEHRKRAIPTLEEYEHRPVDPEVMLAMIHGAFTADDIVKMRRQGLI